MTIRLGRLPHHTVVRTVVATALALAAVFLVVPGARSATSLSVGAPGSGTWQVGQMWHGGALGGGIVPAGTSIDLSPIYGSPLDVYAVAAGRIVKTCVSPTQTSVFVDSPGLGVVGYSHLATGSTLVKGTVAKGQRLGRLATSYVKSTCATSWTGPHLHLSLPARYDVLKLGGHEVERYAVLPFGSREAKTFVGRPSSSLTVTRKAVNLVVCADNLVGNVVHVRLSHPRKGKHVAYAWRTSKRATSRCVTFKNIDGKGRTLARTTYSQRSAVNQPPPTWDVPGCYAATNGQGLCNRARRR
ncbi:hypothetical protein ABIE44_001927 [Marmoricola sp. OAE513]|uniref:M23 family metallopeptidase n=1 Tax=Marmoricola sp. OAE513 TaxID=2817894 RepID=UPI001AE49511